MMGGLINHLWQSTVFAILAGLLTLAFRKNRAQVRYWIWFSASVKFFVPFSLLLALGSYFGRTPVAKSLPVPAISSTVVQAVEPFPELTPLISSPQPQTDWLPIVFIGLWACGIACVALIRLRAWLRIRAAVRASTPLDISFPVPVRCTNTTWNQAWSASFGRSCLSLPEPSNDLRQTNCRQSLATNCATSAAATT